MANEWPPRPEEKSPMGSPQPVPPPPSEIGLRTMQSDIKSAQSGEVTPAPQPVQPPQFGDVMEKIEADSSESMMVAPPTQRTSRVIVIVLGIMVVAAGLGVFGYYVLYPSLFPGQAPIVEEETPPVTAPVTVAPHVSYFVNPPAATVNSSFSTLTDSDIAAELQRQALDSPGANAVKEVVISDSAGNQIAIGPFLSVLSGNRFNPEAVRALLEDDFTTYLYYDDKGVWPAYVTKIRSGVTKDIILTAAGDLEAGDPSLFYLNPAVTFQSFKDGKYKEEATRYAVGSQSGSSFNYGVFGDYLLISTSFGGLKAGVALLGL